MLLKSVLYVICTVVEKIHFYLCNDVSDEHKWFLLLKIFKKKLYI